MRTYRNKAGVERVVIVDEDCNYLGENKVILEELKEVPDDGLSNVDDLRRIDHPSIALILEILVSKSDSQPRSSRIMHQAPASSLPFRVTKASLQKRVSKK